METKETYPTHELLGINWVKHVRDTDRGLCDYQIETRRSIIRMRHEVHSIENRGYIVESFSTHGSPDGATIFVREQ